MGIATVVFALSLFGIIALFILRAWEERTARYLAPALRERADERARSLKAMIAHSQREAHKLPPALLDLGRTILHDAALGAAALARFLERQSHRLAEKVSHKAGFERREPTNEFLKNVSDYKSGVSDQGVGLDTTDDRGQNA